MTKKQDRAKEPASRSGKAKSLQSLGHEATIDHSVDPPAVTVDGQPAPYGTDLARRFYFNDYAYDPADSLEELIEKYLAHLAAVEASRAETSTDTLGRWI